MQKEYQLAVDIEKKILTPSFEVNTLDLKTVKLKITITRGMTLVDLTGIAVRMSIRKPDGNVLFQDCQVVNAKGGQVEIILENQAYVLPGSYSAEIMCFKGTDKVAVTGSFSYKSVRGILTDEAIESKSEFTAITKQLDDVQATVNDLRENGTGIDAQARQEVEQVSELLAETETKIKNLHVDVKEDFGAKGDGVTSDRVSFENALTHIGTHNKILFIPDGVYKLDGLAFTANNNLRIVGQSQQNTILNDLSQIVCRKNVSIENLSILNVRKSPITVSPVTNVSVSIKNITSYNEDVNFTDKTRASSFVEYTNNSLNVWIDKLEISNCDISYFATCGLKLRGYIKGGVIDSNFIKHIGFDSNTAVQGIWGGYQGAGEIENVVIKNNTIENIYSAYGSSGDTTEAHGIQCNGKFLKIRDNIIKNIYGGGKELANLNGGYDHEALYIKADDSIVDNNYIENGSSDLAQGAIAIKGGRNNKVRGNTIKSLYGVGITLENVINVEAIQNTVTIENEEPLTTSITGCLIETGCSGSVVIHNNNLSFKRPRTANNSGARCLVSSGNGIVTISKNYLYSSSDNVLRLSYGDTSNVEVSDNDIISDGSDTFYITLNGSPKLTIKNNRVSHNSVKDVIRFTSGNSSTPRGDILVKNNDFTVNQPLNYIAYLSNLKTLNFIDNDLILNQKTVAVLYLRLAADTTMQVNCTQNNVYGASAYFLSIHAEGKQIGDTIVSKNNVNTVEGYFVHSNASTPLSVNYLCLSSNIVKTTQSNKTLVPPTIITSERLVEASNIVR